MQNTHSTDPVLHPLNFHRATTTGPVNDSEALVMALALALTAPTRELQEMAKAAVAKMYAYQFPATWERYQATGSAALNAEERKVWDWLCFVAEVWADAMDKGVEPEITMLIQPSEVPES